MRILVFLFLMVFAVSPAQAADSGSYVGVVKSVTPSVVNIYAKRVVQERVAVTPFANDPVFQQFFGNNPAFGSQIRQRAENSLGSGVIIKSDGLVVTSYHVVKDAEAVKIVLPDRREFDAKLIRKDPQTDLAFLKIEVKTPLPALAFRDSDTLEVGEVVLAVGNPFGIGQTVTHGIISGLARTTGNSDYQSFIQTDAPINPGNSGGALVDMQGKLIGINSAIYSTSGGSNGIGFAVPTNMVSAVLASTVEGDHVVRPWIGLQGEAVTAEIAESLGMSAPRGVLVKKVTSGSPAEKAGIQPGDVIVAARGTKVDDERALAYRISTASIGSTMDIAFLKQGKGAEQNVSVTLTAQPKVTMQVRVLKGNHPLAGIQVADLTPEVAEELKLGPDANSGVLILGGQATTPAAGAMQRGDIIIQVGGKPVTTAADLEKKLSVRPARAYEIVFRRGGNLLTLTIRL